MCGAIVTLMEGEFSMPDSAAAANIAVDFDIVRRVGEHRACLFVRHNEFVGRTIERATAIDSMLTKQPQVVGACHCRSNGVAQFIRTIGVILRIQRLDAQINFRQLKPIASKSKSRASSVSSLSCNARLASSQDVRSASLLSASRYARACTSVRWSRLTTGILSRGDKTLAELAQLFDVPRRGVAARYRSNDLQILAAKNQRLSGQLRELRQFARPHARMLCSLDERTIARLMQLRGCNFAGEERAMATVNYSKMSLLAESACWCCTVAVQCPGRIFAIENIVITT